MENVKSENEEEWAPAIGFEGSYSVSTLGGVRREKRGKGTGPGKSIKPWNHRSGYLHVDLWVDGVRYRKRVHHLVAMSFLGDRPLGQEICHNDGDKTNNRLSNLRYDSKSANLLDGHRYGGRVTCQKLSLEQVAEIRQLFQNGESDNSIALRYGVCRQTVNSIRNGKRWSHRLDQTLLKNQESEECTSL